MTAQGTVALQDRGGPVSGSGVALAVRGLLALSEQGGDGGIQVPLVRTVEETGRVLDVSLDIGDADAGDGQARGFGQVGQPVWAGRDDFPGIGQQQPDVLLRSGGGAGRGLTARPRAVRG